ncbi:MAG: hypothetical protein JSR31_02035 [Nitrospira sp.]|nr:hypothetical protein [Nitrospira sp.]
MAKQNRDEFSAKTKKQIGTRAGWHCSDPACRRLTVSANSEGTDESTLGIAAHICAAAYGGPRYDENQTPAQRSSADNGIWLCTIHGAAVDKEDPKYTVALLREWKAQAQRNAWRANLYNEGPLAPARRTPSTDESSNRIRAAAAADLDVFRHSDKWPSTAITLTLEVDGLRDLVSTSELATALITLDDFILVAPPGMGKTTTLFQVAEALLANCNASPIIVPLSDWSTDGAALLESVLKRHTFQGISEDELRVVAAKPGVILLLDGWNELDVGARKRAAAQVRRLQAELPELSLLISTRQQALDVPVDGTRINLLPLRRTQQLDIAKALRGDVGVRMLDQAWRTAGVRELVTIPLYLTALLALPEGTPFPTTKEEVLRRFVSVHDGDTQRAGILAEVTYGLHQRFLEDLAKTANQAAYTTIPDVVARKSVSDTESALVTEGQITEKPQPNIVLEALVGYHLLLRIGDPVGYSFQHQQFQEWYASLFVERLMMASISDTSSRNTLKAEVLNLPVWEESILFACERLARGDLKQQECCSAAIMAAFEVDPMLAAEMIFRSTDAIWVRIGATIRGKIERWHTPGQVDRALRFMMSSSRPEFVDQVWPLITHEDDQVHLRALRAGRSFRPSLLGSDAAKRIAVLPPRTRTHVLYEIVMNSGMDGLDLAAGIAKNDPDPEIKAKVIAALAFRHANRHIADVLHCADEKTFDLVLCKDILDETTDESIIKGMEAARERQRKAGDSAHDRLRTIVYARGDKDLSDELTAIIAEMEIDKKSVGIVNLLYMLRNRYSRAIAAGLLQRVRAGRTLLYGADDLLASANLRFEDEVLIEIALAETARHDDRAEAAASVLGPLAVGRMIETAFEANKHVRGSNGQHDQAAVDRYYALLDRIGHTPGASLVAAVRTRSAQAGNKEMADLADLISRHPNDEGGRGRPFDADALATIRVLAEDWGNRMLASSDAMRSQLSSIAKLVCRAPSVGLLQLLKRLLDEDLRRYRAFRQEAEVTGWRQGKALDEARTLHTYEYERAFHAIKAPATAALMCEYLRDEHFGQSAALVLAGQWSAKNEPTEARHVWGQVDFSRVEEKRAARVTDPAATSAEAEAIFGAIEPLIADDATEVQNKHAIALGIVAARLPHGERQSTIETLISLASRQQRAALLQNLILSGENVNIELVKSGLSEMFGVAKQESWILWDGYEVRYWLRLLPFSNPTAEASAVVRGLPNDQRRVDWLEDMIGGFRMAPGTAAESVLFQLAEDNPNLYGNYAWRDAVLRRGTLSSAVHFVDLAASGVLEGRETYPSDTARQIAGLMSKHAELRTHVYQLLENGASMPSLGLLAQAVAEAPDTDGLLLLIKHNPSFISRLTIERVVTEHVPSEDLKGAYTIVPVPAIELRQKLLAMTVAGNCTAAATDCLYQIDEIRDEYGAPDSEPRHPDLASGKRWPVMMMPDPEDE